VFLLTPRIVPHVFESGQRMPHTNSIASMRRAIETAGIRLVFDRTGAPADILRQDAEPYQSSDLSRLTLPGSSSRDGH
jgi:hypothetical protein